MITPAACKKKSTRADKMVLNVAGGDICQVVGITTVFVEIADLFISTISLCFNLTTNTKHHPFSVELRGSWGRGGLRHEKVWTGIKARLFSLRGHCDDFTSCSSKSLKIIWIELKRRRGGATMKRSPTTDRRETEASAETRDKRRRKQQRRAAEGRLEEFEGSEKKPKLSEAVCTHSLHVILTLPPRRRATSRTPRPGPTRHRQQLPVYSHPIWSHTHIADAAVASLHYSVNLNLPSRLLEPLRRSVGEGKAPKHNKQPQTHSLVSHIRCTYITAEFCCRNESYTTAPPQTPQPPITDQKLPPLCGIPCSCF